MINRFVAIAVLITLISTNLSRFFVYAEFAVNQQYIAANLCENRDKPELHCEGKCYLLKKLKDAEEKEKKQEQAAQKKGTHDFFVVSHPLEIRFTEFEIKRGLLKPVSFQLPQFSAEIPHPPPITSFS